VDSYSVDSILESLRDPNLGRDDFRRLLKTHLFSLYWSIKHIRRSFTTIRSTNWLTYLFTKRVDRFFCGKWTRYVCVMAAKIWCLINVWFFWPTSAAKCDCCSDVKCVVCATFANFFSVKIWCHIKCAVFVGPPSAAECDCCNEKKCVAFGNVFFWRRTMRVIFAWRVLQLSRTSRLECRPPTLCLAVFRRRPQQCSALDRDRRGSVRLCGHGAEFRLTGDRPGVRCWSMSLLVVWPGWSPLLFYLGQLSHFPSCFGAGVTNLNEPPLSLLLPPLNCLLEASSIPLRASVNKKQSETVGYLCRWSSITE